MIWPSFKNIIGGAIGLISKIFHPRGLTRQVAIVAAVVAMIATNLLPGEGNGHEMYYTYPTAFTPAVFSFAIWGPIFIGLLAFAIYQALPSRRDDRRLDVLAWPVIIACLFTMITPFVGIGLSNLVVAAILIALFFAFRIASEATQDNAFFWLARLPVSLFFGWITVAAILNAFQWLSSLGFSSFGPGGATAAAISIMAAAMAGIYLTLRYGEAAFSLVLVWGYIGIVIAHPGAALIELSAMVSTLALILALLWKPGARPSGHIREATR